MNTLLADLMSRGLIHDSTDIAALSNRLDSAPITLYCGFDPTAPSLHVGNLLPLLLLRRFQDHGHAPIVLAGGATGMIGDPSGRDSERSLLAANEIDSNLEGIRPQLERFVSFGGTNGARVVNNLDWTAPISVVEFLREVGKHVNVATMLAKDSVKSRMARGGGLSFTEFSYSLLQANDFVVLHRDYGCELQVAGSDQWGNIVAGIDLCRRVNGAALFGLTAPLVTSSDGKKFGKSVGGGGLWLDAALTSPFALFQYFMNCTDADVEPWSKMLTLASVERIDDAVAGHQSAPHERNGQRFLARAICELVHGHELTVAAERASGALFNRTVEQLEPASFEMLEREVPFSVVTASGLDDLEALLASAFDTSKGQVRKNATGYTINGRQIGLVEDAVSMLLHGRWLVLRKGKATYHLVRVND